MSDVIPSDPIGQQVLAPIAPESKFIESMNRHPDGVLDKMRIHFNLNIEFLGYNVTTNGIKFNKEKVGEVDTIQPPEHIKQSPKFHETWGYYSKCYPEYVFFLSPLVGLSWKRVRWKWNVATLCDMNRNKLGKFNFYSLKPYIS